MNQWERFFMAKQSRSREIAWTMFSTNFWSVGFELVGVKRQKIAFLIDGEVPESQCFREFRKILEKLLALTLDEC
jgi:hypothetical protein